MTAKGLYDLEHAYKIAELTKNGDEKRLENGKKMADVCVKGIRVFFKILVYIFGNYYV